MPDDLSTQERIALAEAEEVEAMRDILKAEARAAAAEAQMIEDLVEVNRAMGNVLMGLTQQGPLETGSPAKVFIELIKAVGTDTAVELLKEGWDYVKDLLGGTAERQKGRAEQTRANAIKEAVIKGHVIEQGGGFPAAETASRGTPGAEGAAAAAG